MSSTRYARVSKTHIEYYLLVLFNLTTTSSRKRVDKDEIKVIIIISSLGLIRDACFVAPQYQC